MATTPRIMSAAIKTSWIDFVWHSHVLCVVVLCNRSLFEMFRIISDNLLDFFRRSSSVLLLLWNGNAHAFMALNLIGCTHCCLISIRANCENISICQIVQTIQILIVCSSSHEMCSLNVTAHFYCATVHWFLLLLLRRLRYSGARFSSSPAVYGDVCYVIALAEEIFVQHRWLSQVSLLWTWMKHRKKVHTKCIICTMHCRYFASDQLNR